MFYLAAVYGFSYPYVLSTLRSTGIELGTRRIEAVWLAAGYLLIMSAAGLVPPPLALDGWERWRKRWRLPPASLSMIVAVGCVVSLALLAAALPGEVKPTVALNVLLAYLRWPMLLAGLVGIILLVLSVRENVLALPLLAIFFSSGLFILLSTAFTDHPWSERRATSIALPFLMLCAGIAVAEVCRWVTSVAGSGGRAMQVGRFRRTVRYLIAVAVLIAVLVPMARLIPAIFWHQEADGASDQLRLLESLFPANAVIYSVDSQAMNLFGPGLSARGGREILSYYSAEGKRPPGPELVEGIGDAALAAGRPFFVVTESDDPPPGHFLWARAWWGEWNLSRMFSKDSPSR